MNTTPVDTAFDTTGDLYAYNPMYVGRRLVKGTITLFPIYGDSHYVVSLPPLSKAESARVRRYLLRSRLVRAISLAGCIDDLIDGSKLCAFIADCIVTKYSI